MVYNVMLWIKDKFGGFSWNDPTWNSISERVKQRLSDSASSWVYIAQALRMFTCPMLSRVNESILAGADPLVVSIGTQSEAFLSGPFIWVYRQPGHSKRCCVVRDTRVSIVFRALKILSQLPGCTFLLQKMSALQRDILQQTAKREKISRSEC